VSKHLLSDYIIYGPPPPDVVPLLSVRITGEEMHLLVHPQKWPRELYQKHKLNILYLFRDQILGKQVDVDLMREGGCLCCDISDCFNKQADFQEKRECYNYVYGLCISATRWANQDRVLSMNVLGLVRGATRQRVNQVLKRDYENLYQILLGNEVIREILEEISHHQDPAAYLSRIMNTPDSPEDENAPEIVPAVSLPD
jgi:hypothetical protein